MQRCWQPAPNPSLLLHGAGRIAGGGPVLPAFCTAIQVPSGGASPAAPDGASEMDKRRQWCSLLSGSANCRPTHQYAGLQHGGPYQLPGSHAAGLPTSFRQRWPGAGAATSAKEPPSSRADQTRLRQYPCAVLSAKGCTAGSGGCPDTGGGGVSRQPDCSSAPARQQLPRTADSVAREACASAAGRRAGTFAAVAVAAAVTTAAVAAAATSLRAAALNHCCAQVVAIPAGPHTRTQ